MEAVRFRFDDEDFLEDDADDSCDRNSPCLGFDLDLSGLDLCLESREGLLLLLVLRRGVGSWKGLRLRLRAGSSLAARSRASDLLFAVSRACLANQSSSNSAAASSAILFQVAASVSLARGRGGAGGRKSKVRAGTMLPAMGGARGRAAECVPQRETNSLKAEGSPLTGVGLHRRSGHSSPQWLDTAQL